MCSEWISSSTIIIEIRIVSVFIDSPLLSDRSSLSDYSYISCDLVFSLFIKGQGHNDYRHGNMYAGHTIVRNSCKHDVTVQPCYWSECDHSTGIMHAHTIMSVLSRPMAKNIFLCHCTFCFAVPQYLHTAKIDSCFGKSKMLATWVSPSQAHAVWRRELDNNPKTNSVCF